MIFFSLSFALNRETIHYTIMDYNIYYDFA